MAVQYLVTEEELEKRDFKKKVIQNIKDSKLTQIELKQEIDHLRTRLKSQYANDDINIAMEILYSEKRKNSRLLTQIDHYEALIANKVTQEEEMMEKHTKQLELLRDEKSQYETNSKALLEEKEKLTINLDALKKQTIQDQIYIKDGEKKILFLQDVIKHREEEILVLKEKLKRFEK